MKYSVLIATYNRCDAVITSISCCIHQTSQPAQIIIVDSSPNFHLQREEIRSQVNIPSHIEFIYLKADMASLTCQRNQAITKLSPDVEIVFFIDDDSYMHPDCADKMLSVYKNDPEHLIVGVQASLAPVAPNSYKPLVGDVRRKNMASESWLADFTSKYLKRTWQSLLLMKAENLFIPYSGHYSKQHAKLNFQEGISFRTLFHGCRMSFRRALLESEQFDTDLVRYCAGEDLDFSYRAGFHGALVECESAKLYHHTAESGRLTRFNSSKMASYNIALFIYKNSKFYHEDVARYKKLFIRRLIAEFLKDALSLRYISTTSRSLGWFS